MKLEIIPAQASLIRFCIKQCIENNAFYGKKENFDRNGMIVINQLRRQQIKNDKSIPPKEGK